MLISSWEWIAIIFVIVALIVWGPQKIPELARSLGQARAEFERASRDFAKPQAEESDDILIRTAEKLGINTEGKTRSQISQEIVEKFRKLNEDRREQTAT